MSEEPFLKRWSRRKVEAREGPKPGDEPAAAEEAKVAALDARSERGDVGRRRPGRRRSAS